MLSTTVALNEPREIGDTIEWLGRPVRIVAKLSREEWWRGVQERRAQDAAHGHKGRAGMYDAETKEFRPTREAPPPECIYCYVVEGVPPLQAA
jgi:hypothetical protein